MSNKKLLVSVSVASLVDAVEASDMTLLEKDLVVSALERSSGQAAAVVSTDNVQASTAPIAESALTGDKLAAFLVSDPRFTARSVKAICDYFALPDAEVRAFVAANASRFSSYQSTRPGIGTLVEER